MKKDYLLFAAPQVLGNYVIQEQIGKGVTCVVYKALDSRSLESFAIKHVRIESGRALEELDYVKKKAVINECEMLRSLRHPNIVRLVGTFETDTHLNLVLEFLECGSLETLLPKVGPFSEETTRRVVVQVLEALEYLASKRIAHRDIKGANLLIDKSGKVKLTDFGLAKLVQPGLSPGEKKNQCFVGTPYWMSPEMVQNPEAATEATDIWSLGCTVIELLTGKPPLADGIQYQVFFRIIECEKEQLFDTSAFSRDCADFLNQCFFKNPKQRPTASAMLKHRWLAGEAKGWQEQSRIRLQQTTSVGHLLHPVSREKSLNHKEGWTEHSKPRPQERERSEFNVRLRPLSKNARLAIGKKHSIIWKGLNSEEFRTGRPMHEKIGSQSTKQSFKNFGLSTEQEMFNEYTEEFPRPKRGPPKPGPEKKQIRESLVPRDSLVGNNPQGLMEGSRKSRVSSGQFQLDTKMGTRAENSPTRQGSLPCHKPKQMSYVQISPMWEDPKEIATAEETEKLRVFLRESAKANIVAWNLASISALKLLAKGVNAAALVTMDFGILLSWEKYDEEDREKTLDCVLEWLTQTFRERGAALALENLGGDAVCALLAQSLPQISTESPLIPQNLKVFRLIVAACCGESKPPLPIASAAKYLKRAVGVFRERVLSDRFAGFYLDRLGQLVDILGGSIADQTHRNRLVEWLRAILDLRLLDDLLVLLLLFVDHKNKPKIDLKILEVTETFFTAGLESKIHQYFLTALHNSSVLKVLTLVADRSPFGSKTADTVGLIVELLLQHSKGQTKWTDLESLAVGLKLRERTLTESALVNSFDRTSRQRRGKSQGPRPDRDKAINLNSQDEDP